MGNYETIIGRQRSFFDRGETRSGEFRRKALTRLLGELESSGDSLYRALREDLGKSEFEACMCEIGMLRKELGMLRRKLSAWMKPRRAALDITNLPGSGRIIAEPYGLSLIFSAWNYPVQLALSPLAGALAAGNCVVLKPSELAPACSAALVKVIANSFAPEHVTTVEGNADTGAELLKENFDYVFFTGGTEAGRKVYQAAAARLIPVTLELGGKSPCVVEKDADIEVSARRIVWGKFMNAGQTCVAPDYVLIHRDIKDKFLAAALKCVEKFFGPNPKTSPDFGRIINTGHFDRLSQLLDGIKPLCGGVCDRDERYIAPTIISGIDASSPLMQNEIFGPLMPVLEYNTLEEALSFVRARPRPLAFYLFTRSKSAMAHAEATVHAGGICVNDVITHLANASMPFGGIGPSGIGAYHGRYSFDTFSHFKPVMRRPFICDLPLRYPPFAGKLKLLNWILR